MRISDWSSDVCSSDLGTPYRIYDRDSATIFELSLDRVGDLPSATRLVIVSPLFRELIIEEDRLMADGREGGEHASIHDLLVSRLRSASPQRKAGVRMPGDSRLKRICEAIIADPSASRTIDDWACDIGISRRKLARRLREEIGPSFSTWRRRARLQEAITRLEQIGRAHV